MTQYTPGFMEMTDREDGGNRVSRSDIHAFIDGLSPKTRNEIIGRLMATERAKSRDMSILLASSLEANLRVAGHRNLADEVSIIRGKVLAT